MIEYITYFNPKLIEETMVVNTKTKTTKDTKSKKEKSIQPIKTKRATTKKKIPATVRNAVWNKSNGAKNKEGTCDVCNEVITFASFHCGHIIAEANGGEVSLTNLKAICGLCNSSMGTSNMDEFIKKYKFDIINKNNNNNNNDGDNELNIKTNKESSSPKYFDYIERNGKYYLTEKGYHKYFSTKSKKELVKFLCDNFKEMEFTNKEELICKK